MRARRQRFQRTRDTVRNDGMIWIELPEQFHAPVEEIERIVDPELQPIQALGIAGKAVRRLHIPPRLVAVSVPNPTGFLYGVIPIAQPVSQFTFSGVSIT